MNYQLPITNYLKNPDWILNSAIIFLILAGLLSLASTAPNLFWMQLLWAVLGSGIIITLANFDWRPFITRPWFARCIYIIAIGFLVLTFFSAPVIRGVRAWLVFGPLQFQASELAKLALIFVYSSFFAKGHIGIAYLKNIITPFLYFLIPAFLILLQPDLGTVLILFGIWFSYLLLSGIRWKHIFLVAIIFAVGFSLMWFNVLKEYQKERILGLFYPEQDPLGINYSAIQSKIAIGSAGFLGKGFGQGTQTQLEFLPEAQTDFIFAAFVEEWGILGGLAVIFAFLVMLFRILQIGIAADNNFSKFICLGATSVFLIHFVLNMGSNLGLLPVIGVPFPFLSYGGSNLLISAFLIGMVQGIVVHKRF